MKYALIAIQARSTSTRFPGKINAEIGGKTLLERIVGQAEEAAMNINRNSHKSGYRATVCVLAPTQDPLVDRYSKLMTIYQGPEQDVLGRYYGAVTSLLPIPDYIVRLTSDCPMLPSALISYHVKLAHMNQYDYVSNVFVRTFMDGFDVEVMSYRALQWAFRNCSDTLSPQSREHVTPVFYTELSALPKDFRLGAVVSAVDLSSGNPNGKCSVDTMMELEQARALVDAQEKKKRLVTNLLGKYHVHTY